MALLTPPLTQGSAIPDGIRVGNVRGGPVIVNTAVPADPPNPPIWTQYNYPTFANGAPGVPVGVIYPYIVKPAAASATNLRTASAVAGAGVLALVAGAGVTLDTTTYVNGKVFYTAYSLDCARDLQFVGTGTTSAVTFTISGWDIWGVKVVEQVTLPVGTNTVPNVKTYKAIHTIQASGASGGTVSIGTGVSFGLPYVCNDATYCTVMWNGVPDYKWNAGSGVLQSQGLLVAADTTFPATATTADPRGQYDFDSSIAGRVLPDGTKVLCIRMFLPQIDPIYTRGTTVNPSLVYGVPQYATGWL